MEKIPWRRKWQSTLVFLPRKPMDREAWQAIDHGIARVGQEWAHTHSWKEWQLVCVKSGLNLYHYFAHKPLFRVRSSALVGCFCYWMPQQSLNPKEENKARWTARVQSSLKSCLVPGRVPGALHKYIPGKFPTYPRRLVWFFPFYRSWNWSTNIFGHIQELLIAYTNSSRWDKASTATALEKQRKASLMEGSQPVNFSNDNLRKVSGWIKDAASLQIWLSVKFMSPGCQCDLGCSLAC